MPKLCMTRTINLSNTQFRYQLVFFVHIYGYIWLAVIKFYMKMMMNTVCNSNLLFIKYIYYTVQVEFCYNVAHMYRASSSLVELCSL